MRAGALNKQTMSETQQIDTFLNALFARTHAVNKTIIVKVSFFSFSTPQVMLGLSGTFLSRSGSLALTLHNMVQNGPYHITGKEQMARN